MIRVKLGKNVLEANDDMAGKLKEQYKKHNIKVINLIGSPGSGKTSILERTLPEISKKFNVAVIEGDILTSRDADRIKRLNVPAVQIQTGGSCHLDAGMVGRALGKVELSRLDLIIIENVGNLVCPACFDLGEDAKVVVASVAEGSDKPAKYPVIFNRAKVCILNKMDLLPYSNFSLDEFYKDIKHVNPGLRVFEVSSLKEQGLGGWLEWLEGLVADGGKEN
ncbi:MAG: hydrogenase nickel incorporation protein HypB [Tepidanaerobacteraceae bacterium]|nr:hydrogenase nickel incorporation protein HypB [Tepidanaerobacteraceae bacterium]